MKGRMNIKYTSDGKKVAIIGKLNATETIVQEVFFTKDGGEIPSGEQFVTKSLHDAPVISWKEKRVAEIEATFSKMDKESDRRIAEVRKAERAAGARIKALSVVASKACQESLNQLEDFVAGNITHVLYDLRYWGCRIVKFGDILKIQDSEYVDDLKLLSLFGRSDGTLQWRVNQYYDHSGSTTEILPAHSLEHARTLAQERFDAAISEWKDGKKNYPPNPDGWLDIGGSDKIALIVPQEVTQYFEKQKAESKERKIAELKKQLQEAMAE